MIVRRPRPSSFSWQNYWACQARWQVWERKVFEPIESLACQTDGDTVSTVSRARLEHVPPH